MRKNEYTWRPTPVFHGEAAYHLGVELEVEAPHYTAHDTGLRLVGDRQRAFYAKRDGSLLEDGNLGFEIVTHPIAPQLWLEAIPQKLIDRKSQPKHPVAKLLWLATKLKTLGFKSHDGGRCGLHVHVSRKAFHAKRLVCQRIYTYGHEVQPFAYTIKLQDSLNNTHFYWFLRLINGKLFRLLSQRRQGDLDQWACQRRPDIDDFYTRDTNSRYNAVNITQSTVEVRVFRGNLRLERIRKAIESVIAAVEFSRHYAGRGDNRPIAKLWRDNLDSAFVNWVMANRITYPNLTAYLRECGAVRSSDIGESCRIALATETIPA